TTADAFCYFLRDSGLDTFIAETLAEIDVHDVASLQKGGNAIRQAIVTQPLPTDLELEIVDAYTQLRSRSVCDPDALLEVAVRSSATAEDLPDASFAGQQETYLNVRGESDLLQTCRRCFASLYTDRAISYRIDKGFDHQQVALSIGVQEMVRSDLGAAGVMFTIDTESGFPDVILINSAYGLGENVVQGAVIPDEFYVFKPTLKQGFDAIVRKKLGSKEFKLIYDTGGGRMTKNVPVDSSDRHRFSISDSEVLQLARWGQIIETHYSEQAGTPRPMDIEWAKDGITGDLFIVQARPETVQSQKSLDCLEQYRLLSQGKVLATGRAVGSKIGTGSVHCITDVSQLSGFQKGEVLIAEKTDPDWEPVMKKAAAIVTERGGRTCHAAIVSRELGLPAVVGVEKATHALKDGQAVTVSCSEGDVGKVYEGTLDFQVDRISLADLPRPKTQVMMNLANPDQAFSLAAVPNDGVGLARMEFIINDTIKIHPMALLNFEKIDHWNTRSTIDTLTRGFADKATFFVDRLAQGIATIAAAFYPKDVIVRMSDFKTNEYANLIGGEPFEPREENPMIGFRGAARYYHPRYKEAFGLECRAIRKVREEMGLINVKLMIPFCRTADEGRQVQAVMAQHGLERGSNGLEIYVMCELPSNVFNAEEFAEIFDGFSIGSNDLTQLILGVDRDSEIVANIFDERNPAVVSAIESVISVAKAKGRKIGICGQAPSDYPDFAQMLVKAGIDSISLTPDAILSTTVKIDEAEKSLKERICQQS
ncbi:MAG: phosphoenolpyruvate synthase, partial [Lacipirellulaceae bacterium]